MGEREKKVAAMLLPMVDEKKDDTERERDRVR